MPNLRPVAQIFYCFDIYNNIISKDDYYPITAKPLVGFFALLIQSGIFGLPMVAIICSDDIAITYRIMIGGGIGAIFTAIKEHFAEAERKRNMYYEIEALKAEWAQKYNIHEAKHAASDKKHAASDKKHAASDKKHLSHEARLSDHEAKHAISDKKHLSHENQFVAIKDEIEWNKPFVWEPFDPPSPRD